MSSEFIHAGLAPSDNLWYVTSKVNSTDIPTDLKSLRACLRCALVKDFNQFYDNGCENCDFLGMSGNTARIHECTTATFQGTLCLLEPPTSWVARWLRTSTFEPGVYAIEVVGQLPDDAIQSCEDLHLEYRAAARASKA